MGHIKTAVKAGFVLEGWKWDSIQVLGDPEHHLATATGHQRQGRLSEREGAGCATAAPPDQGGKGSGEQWDLLQWWGLQHQGTS